MASTIDTRSSAFIKTIKSVKALYGCQGKKKRLAFYGKLGKKKEKTIFLCRQRSSYTHAPVARHMRPAGKPHLVTAVKCKYNGKLEELSLHSGIACIPRKSVQCMRYNMTRRGDWWCSVLFCEICNDILQKFTINMAVLFIHSLFIFFSSVFVLRSATPFLESKQLRTPDTLCIPLHAALLPLSLLLRCSVKSSPPRSSETSSSRQTVASCQRKPLQLFQIEYSSIQSNPMLAFINYFF